MTWLYANLTICFSVPNENVSFLQWGPCPFHFALCPQHLEEAQLTQLLSYAVHFQTPHIPQTHQVVLLCQPPLRKVLSTMLFFYYHCKELKELVLLCSWVPPVFFSLLSADTKEGKKQRVSKSLGHSDQLCLASQPVPIFSRGGVPLLMQNQTWRPCVQQGTWWKITRGVRETTYMFRDQYKPTVRHDQMQEGRLYLCAGNTGRKSMTEEGDEQTTAPNLLHCQWNCSFTGFNLPQSPWRLLRGSYLATWSEKEKGHSSSHDQ